MISVILYGRNDLYGYNYHKRAVISLNCIADTLTHPEDEILFIDCNTPNNLCTFPEAIRDLLTPHVKKILRIIRIRPELYARIKKDSHLNTLESLSRNVGVRRSNPLNPWILSTNSDMVFIPRKKEESLSHIVKNLPDGLYELPRFEIPESLWETVDRTNPAEIKNSFFKWGQCLHLNEVIISRDEIRYDAPGDFQLIKRDQLFLIHGFDEDMIYGWHVDSNICRRLNLLNGKTNSLLDRVFAYHCNHALQITPMHHYNKKENCQYRFIKVVQGILFDIGQPLGIYSEGISDLAMLLQP